MLPSLYGLQWEQFQPVYGPIWYHLSPLSISWLDLDFRLSSSLLPQTRCVLEPKQLTAQFVSERRWNNSTTQNRQKLSHKTQGRERIHSEAFLCFTNINYVCWRQDNWRRVQARTRSPVIDRVPFILTSDMLPRLRFCTFFCLADMSIRDRYYLRGIGRMFQSNKQRHWWSGTGLYSL